MTDNKRVITTWSSDEFEDMIYAAREAHIRFKRARTEFRKGNEAYSLWDEETLAEKIAHYLDLEAKLIARYEACGFEW